MFMSRTPFKQTKNKSAGFHGVSPATTAPSPATALFGLCLSSSRKRRRSPEGNRQNKRLSQGRGVENRVQTQLLSPLNKTTKTPQKANRAVTPAWNTTDDICRPPSAFTRGRSLLRTPLANLRTNANVKSELKIERDPVKAQGGMHKHKKQQQQQQKGIESTTTATHGMTGAAAEARRASQARQNDEMITERLYFEEQRAKERRRDADRENAKSKYEQTDFNRYSSKPRREKREKRGRRRRRSSIELLTETQQSEDEAEYPHHHRTRENRDDHDDVYDGLEQTDGVRGSVGGKGRYAYKPSFADGNRARVRRNAV